MGTVGGKPTAEETEELEKNFDANCRRAAEAIKGAQILLLATGAGFSADSGLAVYKDIADVPAYHKMGVDYMALCIPDWIRDDPEIFYGFWGMCFNDYRDTTPHEGYNIIKTWKEKYFHRNANDVAKRVYRRLAKQRGDKVDEDEEKKEEKEAEKEEESEPKKDEEAEDGKKKEKKSFTAFRPDLPAAGPFFVYTSNVDNHSIKAGFSPNEVHEIHGNTETWQCSRPCSSFLWTAPQDFKFDINKDTMRAPSSQRGSSLPYSTNNGFVDNHPRCMNCGALARPCILMFGDGCWEADDEQAIMYRNWEQSVKHAMRKDPGAKMVIIEIGAGIRVPTVRFQSQSWVKALGSKCTLIRINPDFPLNPEGNENTIPLQTNGLKALKAINEHIEALEKEKQ